MKTEALPIVLTLEDIYIANPCILDEQYTAAATTTPAPEITGQSTPAKPAPFPSVMFTLATLLATSHFRRGVKE